MSPTLLLGLALLASPITPPSGPAPTSSARPAPPQGPVVDADACAHQGRAFRLVLRRVDGAQAPDDLLLTLEQGARSVEARRLNEPAVRWWKLTPPAAGPGWKPTGICRRVEAVPTTAGRLLLLVPIDGRPGADHLLGILYDLYANRVLDTFDLGPLGRLLAFTDGEVVLRAGFLEEGGGEFLGPAAEPVVLPAGGRLVSVSGALTPLNPVLHVRTAGNRIRSRPDLLDTFAAAGDTSPALRRALPTPAALAAAFGWDGPEPLEAFMTGRTADGRDCVQPQPWTGGDWRKGRWYCAPAAP